MELNSSRIVFLYVVRNEESKVNVPKVPFTLLTYIYHPLPNIFYVFKIPSIEQILL